MGSLDITQEFSIGIHKGFFVGIRWESKHKMLMRDIFNIARDIDLRFGLVWKEFKPQLLLVWTHPQLHVFVALTRARVEAAIVDHHMPSFEMGQKGPSSPQISPVEALSLLSKVSGD